VGIEAHVDQRWLLQTDPNTNPPYGIVLKGSTYDLIDRFNFLIGHLNPTSVDAWRCVVFIYDGAVATVYVGDSYGIGAWELGNTSVDTDPGQQFILGSANGNNFVGKMDDLVIYNRALTYQEVLQLSKQTITKY
jgi:hypothetical protein